MALIQCPDCKKEISDSAQSCIGCGRPMTQNNNQENDRHCSRIFYDNAVDVKEPGVPEKQEATLMTGCLSVLMIVGFILFISWLTGPSRNVSPRRQQKTSARKQIEYTHGTINGYDKASNSIIDPINVFKDYKNRSLGISGKTSHGERVTISDRAGNGLKIHTDSGVSGWVSKDFVKED